MPSLRDVKRRITSIKNTSKVTRALEAVSATKMRRWQERALRARPFALKALTLLTYLRAKVPKKKQYPTFKNPIKPQAPVAFLVVSADKGLCGGYNVKLMTKVISQFSSNTLSASPAGSAAKAGLQFSNQKQGIKEGNSVRFIALGRYGRDYLKRRGYDIMLDEVGFGEGITRERIKEMYEFLEKGFLNGTFSKVLVGYTEFISTLRQEPRVRQLLPIDEADLQAIVEAIVPKSGKYSDLNALSGEARVLRRQGRSTLNADFEYIFEPSIEKILPSLVKELTQVALFHMILEANASEHSARMIAMKNATDNAKDMLSDLQLQYNKARQSDITKGVLEVASGAAALQG